MIERLDAALLIGSAVLLVAVAAVRFSSRAGLPSLLIYLCLGMLVGALGIRFDNAALTQVLGYSALIVILAEGGLTTRWSVLRPVVGSALSLATIGVGVSVVVAGGLIHLALGLSWRLSLLYGAVLSSTDAAVVFSTLRRHRVRPRLKSMLEAESGLNDAPCVLLVVSLATALTTGRSAPWWEQVLLIGYELSAGVLLGLIVGLAGGFVLSRAALPAAGLYPLAVVGLTVLAYAGGSLAHASGFLAVYVSAVVLGNAKIAHRQAIRGFADGLAWLAQIGLFVLLGLLVAPMQLPVAIWPALVVGVIMVFVARPAAVGASVTWLGVGLREQAFLSWAGLRGAVPIVLATIALSMKVPGGRQLFDVVFVLVVVFTLAQGATVAPVARFLRLTDLAEPSELSVETAPLDRMKADLLELAVPAGSLLAGVSVDELNLPKGAVVSLILRDGVSLVPGERSRLRVGDELLIVVAAGVREAAERRLREVSGNGRLAKWRKSSIERTG